MEMEIVIANVKRAKEEEPEHLPARNLEKNFLLVDQTQSVLQEFYITCHKNLETF